MLAPWLIMCVYVPAALLVLAAVLLACSDHGAAAARHRIGLGVPTRIIFQRLDWERKKAAAEQAYLRRSLHQWRIDRAQRDDRLGIKLPATAVGWA